MDNLIGKKLDGLYEVRELIGSGGMANVYKAVMLGHNGPVPAGTVVAVKVLRQEYMHDPDLVRRFKNESKAISLLNHPNIVKVYDVSVNDDLQYIVMEYVDGMTLREYLNQRGGRLTNRETVHFISQILKALEHAHANGVVHRDIKPQNIMLLADSTIKVMDFGIARFSRSENQTMTDKAIGSVHYISPEQAKGDTTDAKADIYSVGVMMYEMLSGKLPFESDSPVSVAIKQIADTATPLRELNPAVPEALAAMSPAELKDALAQPSQTNDANVAGKLILDYRWRYYGLVTQKQAEKFVEGTRVEISFPNVSAESVPATVVNVTVDEENGTAKVELLCDYINETVVTLEHEKADITFATYEGIRIDRQALHIVEGQNCVFVKYGNLVYQKNITILFENEDYILVPSKTTTGENEVKLFDEIVVRGTDLYDGKIL